AADGLDEVDHIAGVEVPVVERCVAELLHQDRRAALGQEQHREAGRHDFTALQQGAPPGPRSRVLLLDQFLGAKAIPAVLAEEPNARQPPRPLEAVEIVIPPGLAPAEVLSDLEMGVQPVDPAQEVVVEGALAAVPDLLPVERLLPLEAPQPAED